MNNPFGGITPNLIANPPPAMPETPGAGNATASLSPFSAPQDIDSIIANLTLDRPLKLYIPNKDKYPQWEFRIINSVPHEMADAQNKGFRPVDDPELTKLFTDLIAGNDKEGRAFRPILCARPKAVGDHVRKQYRMKLQSTYAGMDPKMKDLDGKYTENVKTGQDASKGVFSGPTFRIRT